MTVQLITYDLSRPGQDYSNLYESIKNLGAWWHYLQSVWLVVTNQTPPQIRDILSRHIDPNDKLAVFTLQGNWATSNLPQECTDWLRSNLGS